MTFLEECIQDSLSIWARCLKTDFLKRMADGTLSEECFKGYLVEDSLYLREYAKVFAWGIIRAQTMTEIRLLYSLMAFVNENEESTRIEYLRRYGLSDENIQRLPLRPQNQEYIATMIFAAQNGQGIVECMMACLPCMLSYLWIFKRLIQSAPWLLHSEYGRLIQDYISPEYEELCTKWIKITDAQCYDLSNERKQKCKQIFRACSEHEYQFWQMSSIARDDL